MGMCRVPGLSKVPCLAAACLVAAGCASPGKTGIADAAERDKEAAQVMQLEREYWDAELRHDSAAVASLLSPDYLSMSSRGGADRNKAEELELLFGGRVHLESFRFSNMRATWLSPDVVALQYVVDQRFTLDGRALCPHSGSMTVWSRRDGHWLRAARIEYALGNVTNAECPAQPPPAPAAPQASDVPTGTGAWRESTRVPGLAMRFSVGFPPNPGPFLYWLRASPGTAIGIHRHTAEMRIRVLQGRKYVLMGNPPERDPVRVVRTGETLVIPPGEWHVEWWEEETIEEITGVGPLATERPPQVVPARP